MAPRRSTRVDELHVAKYGTGGPACARQHHAALNGNAMDWRDGGWLERRGGSGRELCWFPEPVGGQDCYRAALADGLVARAGVPRRATGHRAARGDAARSAHGSASDASSSPPEGVLGAVRVEIRGRRGLASDVLVLGAMDRPGVAAGAVAAVAAMRVASDPDQRVGAFGLAEVVRPARRADRPRPPGRQGGGVRGRSGDRTTARRVSLANRGVSR